MTLLQALILSSSATAYQRVNGSAISVQCIPTHDDVYYKVSVMLDNLPEETLTANYHSLSFAESFVRLVYKYPTFKWVPVDQTGNIQHDVVKTGLLRR